MLLTTLGGLALDGSGLRRPKPLLLLAYVALEGPKGRRFLSELFFADSVDPTDALTTTLRRLKAVGAVIESSGSVCSRVTCDAVELLSRVDAGAVDSAVALYRGAFLADITVALGPELEEWVYGTREFIAQRMRRTLLKGAEADLASGDSVAAVHMAEDAFLLPGAAEPGSDDMLRMLRIVADVDSTVAERIRLSAAAYGLDIHGTPASPRTTTFSSGALRHHVPVPATSLIGRDEELVEIARLLGARECRLLTLHGPAGVGKSRLALQAASDQHATGGFKDGVVFLSTESVTSADHLAESLAAHLAVTSPHAETWRSLAAAIGSQDLLLVLDSFEHLTATGTLLRGLLGACPRLTLLVTSRTRLNVAEEWVMPIEGLRLPDDDLPWEDALLAESIQLFVRRAQSADVRFRLAPADLAPARRICRAVDGFPLGIELAATCTRLIPLAELADNLESDLRILTHSRVDEGSRHADLRVALEHSWHLVTVEEQAVLARLAVFRGGFGRSAAAAVAGATIPTLMSLVDASLVRMDTQGRFTQHALLHQLAKEKLEAAGSEAESAAMRHAEYYAGLITRASTATEGQDLHAAFRLLVAEEQNILASLDWAAAHHQHDLLVALAEPLLWYFPMSGRFSTGAAVLATALNRLTQPRQALTTEPEVGSRSAVATESRERHEALASLLLGQAWLARYAGSLAEAARLSTEGEQHARSAGSALQLLRALDLRGQALTYEGRFTEARAALTEGVSVARAHGDPLRLSRVACNLALLEALTGHPDAAELSLLEAMEPFDSRRLPTGLDTVAILLARGVAAWCRADHGAAATVLRDAIGLAESLAYVGPVPVLRALLAAALLALAERGAEAYLFEEAREQVAEGLRLVETSKEGMATSMLLGVASALSLRRGDLDRAVREARESYHVARNAGNAVIMLWSLPHLIDAYRLMGEHQRALDLASLLTTHAASPQWLRNVARERERELRARRGQRGERDQIRRVATDPILDRLVGTAGRFTW